MIASSLKCHFENPQPGEEHADVCMNEHCNRYHFMNNSYSTSMVRVRETIISQGR